MDALLSIPLAIATAAWLIVVRYASTILAVGNAFSSPDPPPLPGRFFVRRFKRWWRDVASDPPCEAAARPFRLRAWPVLDLKAGRLDGLMLEPRPALPAAGTAYRTADQPADRAEIGNDLAVLERAVAHGRRLGWRHSSTAVIVPVDRLVDLLAQRQGPAWRTLERYGGDAVATVPPLLLVTSDLADLPDDTTLARLAEIRVDVAFRADSLLPNSLPAAVERVFVEAGCALAAPEAARAMQVASRRLIVTDVADMTELEKLAKAGLRFASGPVFGTPEVAG